MVIVHGRAMFSEDRAGEFGRRNGVPGELLVRASMEKVLAYDGLAG